MSAFSQTVLHRPAQKMTCRSAMPPHSRRRSISRHARFPRRRRRRGAGRPLVPVYSPRAWRSPLEREGPIVVVNIARLQHHLYRRPDVLIACDTGPATRCSTLHVPQDGPAVSIAKAAWRPRARSTCLVIRALEHPFFALPPRKSLDRNDFCHAGAGRCRPRWRATLRRSRRKPSPHRAAAAKDRRAGSSPRRRRNLTMLRMLRERLQLPRRIRRRAGLVGRRHRGAALPFWRAAEGLPLSYPHHGRAIR